MADQMIAGRYRIEDRLGIGGMSTVHAAHDSRLERRVAIKLLAEHLAEDPTFVSRFRREALAAARLVHPNIVQVFDFGLDERTGQHFIVMELVDGQSCAQLLRDRGWLPVDETIDILTQACRGLDHAHQNGVVHRDVKPGNLLLSRDRVIKLADFGIAKATEQSSITQVGSVLGTAAYLAPEQARGEEAGPAADLYALGVVAYQLMSGRLPYEAQSLSELALKQQRELPRPLDQLQPAVPPALAHAIARALALDSGARYGSATEMASALRDGALGIEPEPGPADLATAATDYHEIEDATAATSLLERDPEPTPVHQLQPLPRREPARRRPEPVDPYRDHDRRDRDRGRRRSPARRLFRWLLVLLLLGAGGTAAGIVIADQSGSNPKLVQQFGSDAKQAIQQVKQLIDNNIK
jgi:serine/threonine-protein kinase